MSEDRRLRLLLRPKAKFQRPSGCYDRRCTTTDNHGIYYRAECTSAP